MRVWIIRLAPGERVGFHRHVLDYFWTSVSGGRGRQHLMDGSTVEYTYQPGETRHETYGSGEFKVHDLTNLGDKEMVFMTIEFLTAPTSRCRCRNRCARRWRARPSAAVTHECVRFSNIRIPFRQITFANVGIKGPLGKYNVSSEL